MLYFGFLIHAIFITSKCFFKMNRVFFASGFLLFSAEIFKMKVFGFFAARFLIFSFKIFNMINVKNMTVTIKFKVLLHFFRPKKEHTHGTPLDVHRDQNNHTGGGQQAAITEPCQSQQEKTQIVRRYQTKQICQKQAPTKEP